MFQDYIQNMNNQIGYSYLQDTCCTQQHEVKKTMEGYTIVVWWMLILLGMQDQQDSKHIPEDAMIDIVLHCIDRQWTEIHRLQEKQWHLVDIENIHLQKRMSSKDTHSKNNQPLTWNSLDSKSILIIHNLN
jgi:hypothetical protein